MPGGVAGDIRTPWPKGGDSLIPLEFRCDSLEAGKTSDHIFEKMTMDFAFKVVKAEYTARVITETTAITLNLEDDSATPQVLINDFAVAGSITNGAGSVVAVTVDKTKTVNAGAVLSASYKSSTSDTGSNVVLRVWVKPVF